MSEKLDEVVKQEEEDDGAGLPSTENGSAPAGDEGVITEDTPPPDDPYELQCWQLAQMRLGIARIRERWLATPQGKLCTDFYQSFQKYKEYLKTHAEARFTPNGGPLDNDYPEHKLFELGLRVMADLEREHAEKGRKNLELARRAARCEHRHADGRRCGSPRVKGKSLCYMHGEIAQARGERIDLGPLEDAASVQLAIVKLQRLIVEHMLDARQTAQLTYLIRIAAWNAKNIKRAKQEEEIELIEEEVEGVEN